MGLFQDRRHSQTGILRGRGVGEDFVDGKGRLWGVLPEYVLKPARVGCGRHVIGIYFTERAEVIQNDRKIIPEPLDLLVGNSEAGEPRNVADLFVRQHVT